MAENRKKLFCKIAILVGLITVFITVILTLLQAPAPVLLSLIGICGASTAIATIGEIKGWDK